MDSRFAQSFIMTTTVHSTVLIVGASRGLGHAMAAEFLRHGWNVIGTVRDIQSTTPLHQLAQENPIGYAWKRWMCVMTTSWPRWIQSFR